ncbi:MAG TPA: hypothetical protein VKG25_01065, partial [Bryobacteraceae bacterium]|nr:hypothetical protein [Bryobacteraceae bacterium]
GSWRQQFDWAVVEWNRDNTFEHPAFRNLPDGDLSGLTLTYDETRTNCIPIDSTLFPTVDWPSLRIWADGGTGEQVYKVDLLSNATPIEGAYTCATVQFTLGGSPTTGDYVGFAFLDEHYTYQFLDGDTLAMGLTTLVDAVNGSSTTMIASATGTTITLTYTGPGRDPTTSTVGANGNLVGVYTYVQGTTETWDAPYRLLTGGTSPSKWHISLVFASLIDPALGPVPVTNVRKLRWTYAAAFQMGAFSRSEFSVTVSNWTVTGTSIGYLAAGPGSRRIEDDSAQLHYSGVWTPSQGNFSGGTISSTTDTAGSVTATYYSPQAHSLYLGTRMAAACGNITVSVDAGVPFTIALALSGEDVLVRKLLGNLAPGTHTVAIAQSAVSPGTFYFDFLEIAIPSATLPQYSAEMRLALATDWDTEHSLALAPERTAWMIHSLGFSGRVNHYAGALWFYELTNPGQVYASATVTFAGTPDPNLTTEIIIGPTTISHLNLIGDTGSTLALAFALLINGGFTGIRASAAGNQLTIFARALGSEGNSLTLSTSPPTTNLTLVKSGNAFTGGTDAPWLTDLTASPRLNRAARDWSGSFYQALTSYGLDVTTSFSMELGNGDPTPITGLVQRYPNGDPVLLNTPSYQTNFSPVSTAFWQQVYADMAAIQAAAGSRPYLQFGEVQWWYFPEAFPDGSSSGMPYYDDYTSSSFMAFYGRPLEVIDTNSIDPATAADEAAFLPTLIGAFTDQIMSFVRVTVPTCRFEVLYPCDVNNTAWNTAVNYPRDAWTASTLDCLKTESFSYTLARNLNLSLTSIQAGQGFGFAPAQRSHLVGVSDSSTAWLKEARLAEGAGFESVVLFALDQLCLIGYPLPLSRGLRAAKRIR